MLTWQIVFADILKLFLYFEKGPVGWREASQGQVGGWVRSLVSSAQTCSVCLSGVHLLWEPLDPNLQNGRT